MTGVQLKRQNELVSGISYKLAGTYSEDSNQSIRRYFVKKDLNQLLYIVQKFIVLTKYIHLNVNTCSLDNDIGSWKTIHCTLSYKGGVVKEPWYVQKLHVLPIILNICDENI